MTMTPHHFRILADGLNLYPALTLPFVIDVFYIVHILIPVQGTHVYTSIQRHYRLWWPFAIWKWIPEPSVLFIWDWSQVRHCKAHAHWVIHPSHYLNNDKFVALWVEMYPLMKLWMLFRKGLDHFCPLIRWIMRAVASTDLYCNCWEQFTLCNNCDYHYAVQLLHSFYACAVKQ